jgi:hypothetical protein
LQVNVPASVHVHGHKVLGDMLKALALNRQEQSTRGDDGGL